MLDQRVKTLRTDAGWSQTRLAKEAKVSQQLIGKIEKGRVRESRKLPLIARAFGLTVEQLLRGDTAPTPAAVPIQQKRNAKAWPFPFEPSLLDGLSPEQLEDIGGIVEDRVARLRAASSPRQRKKSHARSKS